MSRLSIVVPVYNTEGYLNRCILSICNQDFLDWELILVYDGSTDSSPTICDQFAAKDSRIRVIHKENKGVSSARNVGMAVAIGEYLTVVDSDDWLESNMYQRMFTYVDKYGLDVVMCDCKKERQDNSFIYTHNIRGGFYNHEQLKSEYYHHLLMMEDVNYPATISNWLIVWKRSLSTSSSIHYIEGIRYSEDLLFGAQIMSLATSFYYMKGEALYHYCIRDESSSHSSSIDKWNDYVQLYDCAKEYFSGKGIRGIDYQIDLMLLFFVYNSLGDLKKKNKDVPAREKINWAKKILNHEYVRPMFARITVHRLPIPLKLKLLTYLYKYKIGLGLLYR